MYLFCCLKNFFLFWYSVCNYVYTRTYNIYPYIIIIHLQITWEYRNSYLYGINKDRSILKLNKTRWRYKRKLFFIWKATIWLWMDYLKSRGYDLKSHWGHYILYKGSQIVKDIAGLTRPNLGRFVICQSCGFKKSGF